MGVNVAVVRLEVALVHVEVAVEVSEALLALARVGVGALVGALAVVARVGRAVVNVHAASALGGAVAGPTAVARARVRAVIVGAERVARALVGVGGALVDVVVALAVHVARTSRR